MARAGTRKVTYSLPVELVERLDRASGDARVKSRMVAEALERYLAELERRVLEAEFAGAAADPLFRDDNQSVLHGFAALDADLECRKR